MSKPTFYGQVISDYGVQNNRVDYGTLAKTFNHVLCNDIVNFFYGNWGEGEAELVLGEEFDDDGKPIEIFQYYIISDAGYDILRYHAPSEIVYYVPQLGVYVWGITHYGTSWDYVLTEIPINEEVNE